MMRILANQTNISKVSHQYLYGHSCLAVYMRGTLKINNVGQNETVLARHSRKLWVIKTDVILDPAGHEFFSSHKNSL